MMAVLRSYFFQSGREGIEKTLQKVSMALGLTNDRNLDADMGNVGTQQEEGVGSKVDT